MVWFTFSDARDACPDINYSLQVHVCIGQWWLSYVAQGKHC